MRAFVALLRKELRSYFGSPLVYLVAAAFLAYTGYYFHSDLIYFLTFGFGVNIMENFWQLLFMDVRLVLIFAVPLLTMRLFAEERRLGTLELLLTYPLRDGAIVAAKLGACLVVIGALLAATLVYPAWVYHLQPFPLRPLAAAYAGLLLLAAACAAYGVFVSSLTDSQVLAAFLTSMPLLLLWLLSWNEAAVGLSTLPPLRAISLFNHFQPFAVPALLGIFVLGELLLDRHPLRLDLTPDARHTLSDQTQRVLDALDVDVRVIAFLRSEDPRNLRIEDMLRQVSARTPRVHVEVVDVNRSPALARQYGVDAYGAMVVESGGRRRVFSNPSEEAFLGALLQVTRQQRKTVGWLLGHGEGDPTSTDHYRGYSTARRLLENEDYDVRPVSLIGDEVPPETTVLVIAGPKRDPLPEELAALDRYFQRPGQALVLLDAARTPELARFLRSYWVEVGDDVVVDPTQRLSGGEYLTIQIPIERGDHPILEPLDAPPLFSLTRSVDVLPGEPGVMMGIAFLRT